MKGHRELISVIYYNKYFVFMQDKALFQLYLDKLLNNNVTDLYFNSSVINYACLLSAL